MSQFFLWRNISEKLCYYGTTLFCFCYYIKKIQDGTAHALRRTYCAHAPSVTHRRGESEREQSLQQLHRRLSVEIVLMWNFILIKKKKQLLNLREYNFLFWRLDYTPKLNFISDFQTWDYHGNWTVRLMCFPSCNFCEGMTGIVYQKKLSWNIWPSNVDLIRCGVSENTSYHKSRGHKKKKLTDVL